MKRDNELVILIVLLVLMYINPSIIARCVNNILGKIVAVACIVYLAETHTILGLLLAVIFIASLKGNTEGMSGGGEDSGDDGSTASDGGASANVDHTGSNGDGTHAPDSDGDGSGDSVTGDKKDDGKDGKTDNKKKTKSEGFTKLSPASVSSGRELIGLEKMMRPVDSNELPFSRPRGTPPSENLLAGQLDMMTPITFDGTMSRNFLPAIF
jgi:hypothetical protein